MLTAFEVLAVPHDADDATVRARYLTLIREFPPETHGERFAPIHGAYEKILTREKRILYRLLEEGREDSIDQFLKELECPTERRRITLTQLIQAQATK